MSSDDPTRTLARQVLAQRLQSLQRFGVEQLGRVPSLSPLPAAGTEVADPELALPSAPFTTPAVDVADRLAATPASAGPSSSPPRPYADMPRAKPAAAPMPGPSSLVHQPYPRDLPTTGPACQLLLDKENEKVRPCTLCKELARTRTQTVYGVGNPRARVAFFGEAPGADEDRQGEPFVGRAGQLLTKIIEACGWKRDDVYILNVLKCRPPENRNPLPAETDHCRQYFERQFEILRSEYIVCVGTVPAQALLETTEAVGKLRGRLHSYRGSKVLVTYHPSYLLRNPAAKKYVWEDMQFLLREMGLPIPKRSGA